MAEALWFIFWFVVLVGVLIFAHEGGHFLFAKLFKVKVLTFCLGFGTPIRLGKFKLSFRWGETEYRIAWFPIGGFVRMLGENPYEKIPAEDQPRSFPAQKPWKRLFIVVGGPMFSILLAVGIFFFYNLLLKDVAAAVVGMVAPDSPAQLAGLLPGDRIVAADAAEIRTWEELDEAIQRTEGSTVQLTVERRGERLTLAATPWKELEDSGLYLRGQRWELGIKNERRGTLIGVITPGSPAHRAGLRSWDKVTDVGGVSVGGWVEIEQILAGNGQNLLPISVIREAQVDAGAITLRVPVLIETFVSPAPASEAPELAFRTASAYTGLEPVDMYVHDVQPGKPAEKLGIKPGDKIVSMFGRSITTWDQFSRTLIEQGDGDIEIQVRHEGEIRRITFRPETIEEKDYYDEKSRKQGLGVSYTPNLTRGVYIPPPNRIWFAARKSVEDTGMAISMNVMGFVRLFQGRVKASEALGSVFRMGDIAGKAARKGWRDFVQILAFLSILLGILNLLPIPLLDGGHVMFITLEVILRRPVSLKAREMASWVGMVLLAALMIFALSNDIQRYWSSLTSFF